MHIRALQRVAHSRGQGNAVLRSLLPHRLLHFRLVRGLGLGQHLAGRQVALVGLDKRLAVGREVGHPGALALLLALERVLLELPGVKVDVVSLVSPFVLSRLISCPFPVRTQRNGYPLLCDSPCRRTAVVDSGRAAARGSGRAAALKAPEAGRKRRARARRNGIVVVQVIFCGCLVVWLFAWQIVNRCRRELVLRA